MTGRTALRSGHAALRDWPYGCGVRLLTWNMNHRPEARGRVALLSEEHQIDAALLQEAPPPPSTWWSTPTAESEWSTTAPQAPGRSWRSAIIVFNPRTLDARSVPLPPLATTADGHVSVSHPGQLAVADLAFGNDRLIAVSLYGIWEWMRPDAKTVDNRYAVPSVHRAISDLTRLWFENDRAVLVAGDFNIWRGEGLWKNRYQTVFDRMRSEGFSLAGPYANDGRSTVPTFRSLGRLPGHQTDFVFARNTTATCQVLDVWTPSDHAPVLVQLDA
jgi:hypothetical protein